jgi:PEP-CTERM motif
LPASRGLAFGNGVVSDEDGLYFAAGIGDELHGLFGVIAAVPEPGSLGLLLIGMVVLVAVRRRRS